MAVSGRLSVSSTEDPATGGRRWFTDVVAEEIEFTESRTAYESRTAQQSQYQARYDNMAEQYTPPSEKQKNTSALDEPPLTEGFTPITEAMEDDSDLPF